MNALTTRQIDPDNIAPALSSLTVPRIGEVMPRARPRALRVAGVVVGLLSGVCMAAILFALTGAMAAAPLAWAVGWLYLVWAQDASRAPAAIVDGSLAALTLGVGFLAAGNPALPIGLFALHTLAWPLRAMVNGRDARVLPVAALWIGFHAAMVLLLL